MIAHNETWIRSNNSHVILPYTELQTTGINFTKFVGFSIFSPEVQLSSDYGGDTMELSNSLSFPISLNSSLNFTISHFEFSCQSVSQCSTDGSWMSLLGPDFIYANSSALLKQAQFGSGFSINTNYTFSSQADPDGAQFITFGSFYNSNVTLWSWQIFAVTKNISIFHQDYHAGYSVFRTGGLDFLESMDPATVTTTPPFTNYSVAASLFAQWPVMDAASSGVSSITEQYLAQGLEGQSGILNASLVDLSDVDSKTFASRLTTMFNTYIQTLQGCSYYGWEDVNGCALNATSSTPLQFQPFALVTCNWVFFAILTIASTLLLICSCLSIWLSYRLSTPDIMGHMSSLAIENPDIPVAGKASGLNSAPDGFERAKLLRDVKVQIRDVQQEDEVGKFTLTSDIRQRQRTGKDRKFV
jgi:hypothetical protein